MEHLCVNGHGRFEHPLTLLNKKQSNSFEDERHFPSACLVMNAFEEDLQSRGECLPEQNQQIPIISDVAFVTGRSAGGQGGRRL